MSIEECGERVLRGIRRNDLYIFTHREFKEGVAERMEAMLASFPKEEINQARAGEITMLTSNPIFKQATKAASDMLMNDPCDSWLARTIAVDRLSAARQTERSDSWETVLTGINSIPSTGSTNGRFPAGRMHLSKTHGRGFPHAHVRLIDGTHIPREAQLSQQNSLARQWTIAKTAENGGKNSQIRTGLVNLQPACRIHINVASAHLDSQLLFEHRHKHGNPVVIDSGGHAARRAVLRRNDESLNLNQQRTRAFERAHDGASGRNFFLLQQKQAGRIRDRDQSPRRHLENADFVRGAKPVLYRADNPMILPALPFEIEDHIHDMLQRLRARDAPVLRNMTDQENRQIPCLRKIKKLHRDVPHLADASRSGIERFGICGLNRIHYNCRRLNLLHGRKNLFEIRFRQQVDIRRREPMLRIPSDLQACPRGF